MKTYRKWQRSSKRRSADCAKAVSEAVSSFVSNAAIPAPHNYDNLTPEQIGDGYRVLSVGEVIPSGAQAWDGTRWFKIRLFENEVRSVSANAQITRRVKI